ncbi:MAG: hypothetical protein KC493_16095 [Bacteriovoracaceae bacterium]|nr:hypothetical protein [Bacteriovoracaceae bacterium]
MLEVTLDTEIEKYVIKPLSKEVTEDYMIVCGSENEAKSLCVQVTMQMIPSPTSNPINYNSIGMHPNGHTRLFQYKNR